MLAENPCKSRDRFYGACISLSIGQLFTPSIIQCQPFGYYHLFNQNPNI